MVKGSVDYSSFESQVLRLDLARADDVDNVESVLKFKDIKAYRESVSIVLHQLHLLPILRCSLFHSFPSSYFHPLLIRELRSTIRSVLQENAQNLLMCPCKSSKVLHGVYGPPSGQSHVPSSSVITSPVYAASQVSVLFAFQARVAVFFSRLFVVSGDNRAKEALSEHNFSGVMRQSACQVWPPVAFILRLGRLYNGFHQHLVSFVALVIPA
jgi:hypothetical protein